MENTYREWQIQLLTNLLLNHIVIVKPHEIFYEDGEIVIEDQRGIMIKLHKSSTSVGFASVLRHKDSDMELLGTYRHAINPKENINDDGDIALNLYYDIMNKIESIL